MHYWSERTELPMSSLIGWLGLPRSKFYDWRQRYGLANEHNAPVPRDFWLEDWEKVAIVGYARAHPLEGYRRLAFRMLDDDIAAGEINTTFFSFAMGAVGMAVELMAPPITACTPSTSTSFRNPLTAVRA